MDASCSGRQRRLAQLSLPIAIAAPERLALDFLAADAMLSPEYPLTLKTINAANRLALLRLSGSDPDFRDRLAYIAAAKRTLLRCAGYKVTI
jgi:hypothetical protein